MSQVSVICASLTLTAEVWTLWVPSSYIIDVDDDDDDDTGSKDAVEVQAAAESCSSVWPHQWWTKDRVNVYHMYLHTYNHIYHMWSTVGHNFGLRMGVPIQLRRRTRYLWVQRREVRRMGRRQPSLSSLSWSLWFLWRLIFQQLTIHENALFCLCQSLSCWWSRTINGVRNE